MSDQIFEQAFNHPFLRSEWFIPLMIWSIIWKGFALWRAGTMRDKWWFVAILIVNTLGILEIFYLFVFSKRERDSDTAANS